MFKSRFVVCMVFLFLLFLLFVSCCVEPPPNPVYSEKEAVSRARRVVEREVGRALRPYDTKVVVQGYITVFERQNKEYWTLRIVGLPEDVSREERVRVDLVNRVGYVADELVLRAIKKRYEERGARVEARKHVSDVYEVSLDVLYRGRWGEDSHIVNVLVDKESGRAYVDVGLFIE